MRLKLETLYELAWILPSIALPFGMLVALTVTAFGAGMHVPSRESRIDPRAVSQTPPFDNPGTVQTGPNEYQVTMTSRSWAFEPREIRVPEGSTVTFVATSHDVVHGLLIAEGNVNIMLIPGQVARTTATFRRAGEYNFLCHEYCGVVHHTMFGKLIVEPAGTATAGRGGEAP